MLCCLLRVNLKVPGDTGVRSGIIYQAVKREKHMLWTIVVILVILWLLGFIGPRISSRFPRGGNVVHVLLVIAIILVVLNLAGVI
jgi:hypothetical protein